MFGPFHMKYCSQSSQSSARPSRHFCALPLLPSSSSSSYAHPSHITLLITFTFVHFRDLCLVLVVSHDTHSTDKIRSKNKFCVSSFLLFFHPFLSFSSSSSSVLNRLPPLHPPQFLYGNLVDGNHKIYMLLLGRTVI